MPNIMIDSTGRGPSPALAQIDGWRIDSNLGLVSADDFYRLGVTTDEYVLFATSSTSSVAAKQTDQLGGVIKLAIASADNGESNMQAVEPRVQIDLASGKPVVFECRVKTTKVDDNINAMLAALMVVGQAKTLLQADDTGVVVDKDFIGFRTVQAAGATLDAVHKKEGQTLVTDVAAAKTLVADTWVKLGFVFDGQYGVTFYVDGAQVGSTATLASTNAPVGVMLAPVFGTKVGSNTSNALYVDWWYAALKL